MPRVGRAAVAAIASRSGSSSEGENEEGAEGPLFEGSIFKSYVDACSQLSSVAHPDEAFEKGMGRVKEYLAGGGEGGACLICLSAIRPQHAIWSCRGGCYAAFHLPCIQEWARNQLDAAEARAATRLSPANFPGAAAEARAAAEWACPKCRFPHPAADLPKTYSCYCGKQVDPEFDPWQAPHTCGDLCGRPLPGGCAHTCLLLCHPGPCPPCPLVVSTACPCGKSQATRRCGAPEPSCGAPCGRRLACGHPCAATCHEGACPPCQLQGPATCPCGSETRQLACSERPAFRCHRECGRLLACGRHHCPQVCHKGPCGACPSAGPRTCPCGKQAYTGLQCDEAAPTCGDTCGQLLQCGRHRCNERCHTGPCVTTCRATVSKLCRCGKSCRSVQCGEEVRCDRRCGQLRACGRHPCKRRCCDGDCPPCEETCGRKLRCGNHKCPAPCHLGPCRPCPLTSTVACACGRTATSVPCGAEALAAPPRCFHPCPVRPTCRHGGAAKPHRCHFGPCPPCTAPCATPLPCAHPCASPACHDLHPPPVPPFAPPKPPKHALAQQPPPRPPAAAALIAAEADALRPDARTPCPPCQVPVATPCLGSHTSRPLPCAAAGPYACDAPCGRPLACGNHACPLPCHLPTDGSPPSSAPATPSNGAPPPVPTPCQQCSGACAKPRACPHPCPQPCHPGACPPCTRPLKTTCHCGRTPLTLPCHHHAALTDAPPGAPPPSKDPALREAAAQLQCGKPCGRPLPACPHFCAAPCHPGACPMAASCGEEVPVRCGCRRLKAYWPCHRVRYHLATQGQPASYGPATQLRLLPCTDECAAAAAAASAVATPTAEAAGGGRKGARGRQARQGAEAEASAAAPGGASGSGAAEAEGVAKGVAGLAGQLRARVRGLLPAAKQPLPEQQQADAGGEDERQEGGGEGGEGGRKRRLTREERARAAEERAAAQERAALVKRRVAVAKRAAVVAAGVALALLMLRLLMLLDQRAVSATRASAEL